MTTYDPAIHEIRPVYQTEKLTKLQQSGTYGVFLKPPPKLDPILNTPLPGAFNALAFWGDK